MTEQATPLRTDDTSVAEPTRSEVKEVPFVGVLGCRKTGTPTFWQVKDGK
jgi:hypothetical protein